LFAKEPEPALARLCGPTYLPNLDATIAEVAVLVIPTAFLKLEQMLATSNTVVFDLRQVSSRNRIPALTPGSVEGSLNFGCRSLPVRNEYYCGVAPRKDMVLKATL